MISSLWLLPQYFSIAFAVHWCASRNMTGEQTYWINAGSRKEKKTIFSCIVSQASQAQSVDKWSSLGFIYWYAYGETLTSFWETPEHPETYNAATDPWLYNKDWKNEWSLPDGFIEHMEVHITNCWGQDLCLYELEGKWCVNYWSGFRKRFS